MENKKNEVAKQANNKPAFKSALASYQETFTNMVVVSGSELNIAYSDYQKVCVLNLISKMYEVAKKNKLNLKDMDKGNITQILQTAAMLNLNISSVPSECYLIVRSGEFEFGIEGDGNDKLLRTFGVDVKKVYTPWIVREKDEFTYPSFNGLEITPPTWSPKDYGSKVVRVVYPIEKTDGSVEYHIAERADVARNLQAHIANNLLFKKDIRDKVIDKTEGMTLEEMLSDKELQQYISPAWKNPASREAMIVRKMKNNATKKFPKDFKNAFAASEYQKSFEDYDQYQEDDRINKEEALLAEVEEQAMSEKIDVAQIETQTHDKKLQPEAVNSTENAPY